jgi:hypothetical protein
MSEKFLTEQNLSMLFNMMNEYVYQRTKYEIGEGEWKFLVNVMKRYYTPNVPLRELNKRTLDHVIPVIMKKLQDNMISSVDRTLPVMSQNQDVDSNYQRLLESRKPVENIPNPPQFTDPEPQYQPITESPEDMIRIREQDNQVGVPYSNLVAQQFSTNEHTDIVAESKQNDQLDVVQSREFKTLQPEPEELKQFYENEKNDLYFQEYIVVDSRDRNHNDYPNSNNYRVDLERDVNDVISIQLVSAEVPKSEYVINASNNKIYFQELNSQVSAGTVLEATLSVGNYTITELKTEIETQMDAIGTANYTVTINSKTNTINVSSDLNSVDLFNFLFQGDNEIHGNNNNPRTTYRDNSIGPVIGFSRTDLSGASNYTGDLQYNLDGEKYVMLHLRNIPMIDGIADGVQNAFHKITLNTTNNTKYYQEGDYKILKKLNSPIKRLNELEVSFRNYNNDLYDFHGLEHSLTFKVTSIKGKTI